MTKLSVNINKIATLRNTRPHLDIPNLIHLSEIAVQAGAAGITIHPRPDERHIRADDVDVIANWLKKHPGIEFNIEGNPFEGDYMEHCLRVRPTQCTLVPDVQSQSTSDHGWDLTRDGQRLKPIIERLKVVGCRVSLFMDPEAEAMRYVPNIGADRVELYTEPYAAGFARAELEATWAYEESARAAHALGLGVNAGHDLSLDNLGQFLKTVPHILEVSIGHALIADALEFGLDRTIRKYRELCEQTVT